MSREPAQVRAALKQVLDESTERDLDALCDALGVARLNAHPVGKTWVEFVTRILDALLTPAVRVTPEMVERGVVAYWQDAPAVAGNQPTTNEHVRAILTAALGAAPAGTGEPEAWEPDPEWLESVRRGIEDELIELRDSRISLLGLGNGLVVREKDGTESSLVRMRTIDAIRFVVKRLPPLYRAPRGTE